MHADVDGLFYGSRLTGEDIYAVFDRSIGNLAFSETGIARGYPELPDDRRKEGVEPNEWTT